MASNYTLLKCSHVLIWEGKAAEFRSLGKEQLSLALVTLYLHRKGDVEHRGPQEGQSTHRFGGPHTLTLYRLIVAESHSLATLPLPWGE